MVASGIAKRMRVDYLKLHQTKLVLQNKEVGKGRNVEEITETGIYMKVVKADDADVFIHPWNRRITKGEIFGTSRVIQDGRLKYNCAIYQQLFDSLREILVMKLHRGLFVRSFLRYLHAEYGSLLEEELLCDRRVQSIDIKDKKRKI